MATRTTSNQSSKTGEKPPEIEREATNGSEITIESGQGSPRVRHTENVKAILDEVDGYQYTAYAFPTWKKWMVLSVVALCQTSMNFVRVYPYLPNK
jgi:hypothetical protein